jgi:hypothetical protein
MRLIKIFLEKIDLMLTEQAKNDKYVSWSSTKIGIFFFLYPVSSFCLIYDTYINNHLDWLNLAVYGIAIVSPRALSNLVSMKITGKEIPLEDTSKAADPVKDEELKQ